MADQDNSFAANVVPEVQNKAPKAPGVLPKNAQTWVIVIIAAIMILVIAFSNSGTPKPKPKSVSGQQQTASPPNQRQIDQYRAMVDEEARKLALERQRLDQAKLDAQNAAVSAQTPIPGQVNPYQQGQYPPAGYTNREQSPEEVQRLALEAERKKREYNSLFSSNLSLSYRKDQNPSGQGSAPPQDQQAAAALPALQGISAQLNALRQSPQNATLSAAGALPTVAPQLTSQSGVPQAGAAEAESPVTDKRKQQADDPSLQQADGKKYRLFEGTVLETVLTNRLNGSFSGPINVMVTTTVYSHDHQQLLIPQGSRVLGEVQKVNSFGQQRLAVMFHRLIMPDGYSLSLDQFQGLNQIGETGLRDQVNHHYAQVFGISLAIGAIAGIEQAGANYGYNTSGMDLYRQGVSQSLSQSALRILDRYLNILPTFVIREGHRVKVYLTDDLMLPAYDRHRMPGNL
jgi:type IV secretion system protein TrbI